MKKPLNLKKLLIPNIPYVVIALLATKLGQAARFAPGADFSQKALHIMDGFKAAFSSIMPSFHPIDLCVGVAAAVIIRLVVYFKGKNAKKFRKNTEYGSARWGTQEDIAPFVDPKFENNVILTQTERLMMSNRPKDPTKARNKNVLVVGGSGSGKTRFFIKPNIMQLHSSYVVTDPKGTLVLETGSLLVCNQYRLKIFNSINFKKSMHYNPFAYIRSEKDILKLVTTLISNTKGEGKSGDDFWQKAETLLYCALIGYIHYEAPMEEQNFATLIEFVNAMEVREDDETFENPVDLAFKELAGREPQHFAVRQYAKYKLAAGKTAKSINISCGARLAPFDIQELREITMYDELELDTLGDRKTALFLIMSDTDSTFNFLISMIYSQLFNLLCEKADDVYGGRLPVHVRCLIDEAANIGQIPNLEKLMATIRSREISACLVLQAQSQLKALYKDNADTIIGNCDSSIFLGGKEPTTLKELNQALGKETIDLMNTGESRGREVSHSLNYQKLGKDLASIDELAVLDGGKCILQLRGVRPFMSDKYDITKHSNYKYLSDADSRRTFNIEKFLSTRLVPKEDEEYEVFDVAVTDTMTATSNEGEM
jgi:type IV secretion system protein VirD4